jgi:hypothetical protein
VPTTSVTSSGRRRACELAAEGRLVEVVDEGALAADLDDREPLAVARLELGVARDVDLLEGERQLLAERGELAASPLAERAALGVEERDGLQG